MIHTPRRCDCPAQLASNADRWTARWQRLCQQNPTALSWATRAAKELLKPLIRDLAYGKCVFCEGALEVTGHLEIEHYVAKTREPHRCFEWTNLLPACSKCNRAKGEQDHGGALFKPDDEDPEPFFWIHPDTGELEPHPSLNEADRHRAVETIRICELQRPRLCTQRIAMLRRVSRWIDRLASGPMTEALEEEWNELLDPQTEYKLVLRHVLTQKGQAELAAHDRRVFKSSAISPVA